ncbi:MAG: hypothetical protein Q8R02_00605 [Hyphomonadaceae bacterium]|nr:hypothetical protein [Hyphomonadaceae bacterium]
MPIEKKMTLAIVLAVVLESAGVLLWVGAASERLKEVEVRVAAQSTMAERMARVEVRQEKAAAQLGRIERKLDGR